MGVAAERYSVRSAEGTTSLSVATRSLRDPASQLPAPDTLFPGTDDSWDPFREMRDLQAEMDRMFQRSISRFNSSPMMDPFKNDTGYSQSLDVRELKDRFEVRAYLPDAQATDTNVKLDGNRLQVEVTHRQANRLQDTNSVVNESALERYTQVADLPGRLNGSQMKVEQKDHELLITIPKAK
jgi:HSP20 family molecular chaperone IbpA